MRSDDHRRGHVCIRNSGKQLSLANGDLEPRWRSLDRWQKWPFRLEMDRWADLRCFPRKATYRAVISHKNSHRAAVDQSGCLECGSGLSAAIIGTLRSLPKQERLALVRRLKVKNVTMLKWKFRCNDSTVQRSLRLGHRRFECIKWKTTPCISWQVYPGQAVDCPRLQVLRALRPESSQCLKRMWHPGFRCR